MTIRKLATNVMVALLVAAGTGVSVGTAEASASGATKAPITIGVIASFTGSLSYPQSEVDGGLQARFNLQNEHGGVNGHKLKMIVLDDGSSPQGSVNAANVLVQEDHVFAVINTSILAFASAPFLNQQGVPVVGYGVDGPEWGQQPYTNMFSVTPPESAPYDGKYYGYNTLPLFLKYLGVKQLAGVGYNIESGIRAQLGTFKMASALGIGTCYNNTTVPLGAVDFTAIALQIKSAKCDGVVGTTTVQSTVSMSQELKQAGVTAKQVYYEGYSQTAVNQPATMRAYDGAYFEASLPLTQHPNAATSTMLSALRRWGNYKGGIPDAATSYELADIMITGLEKAGANPTRSAFITNLRKVSNYNGGGLLASPISFAHFGTAAILPKTSCSVFVQAKGDAFVPVDGGKAFCGKLSVIG